MESRTFLLQGELTYRVNAATTPGDESEVTLQRLQAVGLIQAPAGPNMAQVLAKFEPLLQRIVAAADDEPLRPQIEPILAQLQENGLMLTDAAHRIWAGERDAEALTAGLDDQDGAPVRNLLQRLEG